MTISYSIPNAAAETGLNEATVRAAIRDGKLAARVADGGRLLILSADLSDFVARLPRLLPAAEAAEAKARTDAAARARGAAIVRKIQGEKSVEPVRARGKAIAEKILRKDAK